MIKKPGFLRVLKLLRQMMQFFHLIAALQFFFRSCYRIRNNHENIR